MERKSSAYNSCHANKAALSLNARHQLRTKQNEIATCGEVLPVSRRGVGGGFPQDTVRDIKLYFGLGPSYDMNRYSFL